MLEAPEIDASPLSSSNRNPLAVYESVSNMASVILCCSIIYVIFTKGRKGIAANHRIHPIHASAKYITAINHVKMN